MSIFRVDPPAYEEILAVRAERQQLVTDFLATATPELLAEERQNPWGGGDWHPTIGDCIRVILEKGVGAPALHPTGSGSYALSQKAPARGADAAESSSPATSAAEPRFDLRITGGVLDADLIGVGEPVFLEDGQRLLPCILGRGGSPTVFCDSVARFRTVRISVTGAGRLRICFGRGRMLLAVGSG
jgi:hypothetical protein